MTVASLLELLREAPLVASVQTEAGSALDQPETLLRLARASIGEGVRLLRLQGIANIDAIRTATHTPTIGLIKRSYPGSEVYITPTLDDVEALADAGCEVIAFDATDRPRPKGVTTQQIVTAIHQRGRLAMADCDGIEAARHASAIGVDLLGTTLAGYTRSRPRSDGPDLNLLRDMVALGLPVLAEGRFSEPWQVQAAIRMGAIGVVIGGALNDPVKQTAAFSSTLRPVAAEVGAIDIGGTWLRAGIVAADGAVRAIERVENPKTRGPRLDWINAWIARTSVSRVGIGAGGIIDPPTGEVVFSKPMILDHVGTLFKRDVVGAEVFALNDGHATAWGHAMHPRFAGRRTATIALGTGVGCGVVDRGRILMGPRGEHPRLNDTPTRSGKIYEELLGGAALSATPSEAQRADAQEAAIEATRLVHTLYYPDAIVFAGSVGLAPWLDLAAVSSAVPGVDVAASPYGTDAGLVGAGMLALFPI